MLRTKNKSIYLNVIKVIVFLFVIYLYFAKRGVENALLVNSMRVFFAICFLSFVIKWKRINFPVSVVLSGIFVIYAMLSLSWSYYKQTEAVRQIIFDFILSTLLVQCIKSRKDLEYVLKCMAISGIGICVMIITNTDIRSLTSRISVDGYNVNTLGILLIFSGLCCWYMYTADRKRIWMFLFFAYIGLSLLTGSKKVLIMIGTVILFYIIWTNKKTLKGFMIVLLLITLFVIGCYAIFKIPLLYNVVGKRMEEFLLGLLGWKNYNVSDQMREYLIERALELFYEHPVWGIGADNYSVMNRYGVYSHCNYTEILCNYGLIGFFLYYSRNIYYFITYMRMERQKKKDGLSRWTIAVLGIYFLIDFAMVSYYSLYHQVILALIYYMLFYASEKENTEESK